MKSGTTTLHHILGSHKDVFIPMKEPAFFDIDDFEQRRNDFVYKKGGFGVPDYQGDFEKNLDRYQSSFDGAVARQIVGEDTTTYLASRKAPARIAELLPEVKLVFLLRDPVKRAISHYWHMVGSGSMIYSFEGALRRDPSTILQRGHYREQLSRYLEHFDRSQILVLIFEQMKTEMQQVVDRAFSFIGIKESVDVEELDTHRNPTKVPRFAKAQPYINKAAKAKEWHRILTEAGRRGTVYPGEPRSAVSENRRFEIAPVLKKAVKSMVFSENAKFPPIAEETENFLRKYYRMENRGISDMLGLNVEEYWSWMTEQ